MLNKINRDNRDYPREWMLVKFDDIKNIEGMILTIVDSLGLELKQDNAVKSLVRQAIWDEVHKPYRVWMSAKAVDDAHEEWEQYKGHSFSNGKAIPLEKKSK